MQLLNLNREYSHYRVGLEKLALLKICSCLYYDLADSIDAASDQELIDYIADRYDCDMCGMKGAQS
jgi:hypothetical protein